MILDSNHKKHSLPLDEKKPEDRHISVLAEETLSFFEPVPQGKYVDGTLGLGGHASLLLEKASQAKAGISLLGLDRDVDALPLATKRLQAYDKQEIITRHACFSEAPDILQELGWDGINGALIDIGVSSMQIDEADRGFSFLVDGPLDMRMDRSAGKSAKELVNRASVQQLKDMIVQYGEDPMAGKIARAIDDARAKKSIETTAELAKIVEQAYPPKWRAKARNHPAMRTFQALRIVVNDELGELVKFLEGIVPLLSQGGRVAVITFHSLEDRIVKHFFRDQATGCNCPRHISRCICGREPIVKVLTRKPVEASQEELKYNTRASSAKLRVAEKL